MLNARRQLSNVPPTPNAQRPMPNHPTSLSQCHPEVHVSDSRRTFLQKASAGLAGAGLTAAAAPMDAAAPQGSDSAFPRPTRDAISLAMYSLNRSYTAGLWDLLD